ncbi:UDP-N-acetylmuramate--L-alanine ligase [Treponema primitia ZAS-2]|uniref:UDP-N-acetylmuramate--L-alanine ligase n=1 Tax=Treponema primitia (strain ATCC BAA-887 / DSM 12427 / ZAS-2) TaxID=545694 RepID=F5YHG6_TREPZ|nr:UDP-N-acetylmuramate--L-alanine ligase [Treponema primitia]AEF84250.1 UDP-N-acetylmuramate--L-alanine ligase [Treponema primitia ZAS-2]
MNVEKLLSWKGAGPGPLIYFIGIKGTGMCALAELLHNSGFSISGSDRDEVFYTDGILKELGIPYVESFAPEHVPAKADLVIYSAAYSAETNSEIAEAKKQGLPVLKYTDALGVYSAGFDSAGIAGVHGKTTTTAMAGTLIRGAGLPARILAGSAVAGFGGRSTLILGDKYFVAETCEYRRHFLSFHPHRIILTSVESDHQDYYPTYESIRDAFIEYAKLLPVNGELIYCADDPGACEVANSINKGRVKLIPYGFTASGNFKIVSYKAEAERSVMRIAAFPGELRLRVPGRHCALDAAAALALTDSLVRAESGSWTAEAQEGVRKALEDFRGSRRRSEVIGEAGGILFMDDYGHHPTAIKTTLEGLREFYPRRRLVLSFMSHTYTRTAALLDEFAASLEKADLVVLHKIYGSAREAYQGGVNGKTLYEKTKALRKGVYYEEEPLGAVELLKGLLKPGDLLLTMGAGDNWKLGKALFDHYSQEAPR